MFVNCNQVNENVATLEFVASGGVLPNYEGAMTN